MFMPHTTLSSGTLGCVILGRIQGGTYVYATYNFYFITLNVGCILLYTL